MDIWLNKMSHQAHNALGGRIFEVPGFPAAHMPARSGVRHLFLFFYSKLPIGGQCEYK